MITKIRTNGSNDISMPPSPPHTGRDALRKGGRNEHFSGSSGFAAAAARRLPNRRPDANFARTIAAAPQLQRRAPP